MPIALFNSTPQHGSFSHLIYGISTDQTKAHIIFPFSLIIKLAILKIILVLCSFLSFHRFVVCFVFYAPHLLEHFGLFIWNLAPFDSFNKLWLMKKARIIMHLRILHPFKLAFGVAGPTCLPFHTDLCPRNTVLLETFVWLSLLCQSWLKI